MLRRLHDLAESRVSFAFETTLASRSFAPWIAELVASGYEFQLFFFWVPSPEFSIQRVANRVKLGGHFVDPDTIRRRFRRGLENLFHLYLPLTSDWFMYDNTQSPGESLIARGHGKLVDEVGNAALWSAIKAKYDTPR
jgi:predicted ABC-type ATPase